MNAPKGVDWYSEGTLTDYGMPLFLRDFLALFSEGCGPLVDLVILQLAVRQIANPATVKRDFLAGWFAKGS